MRSKRAVCRLKQIQGKRLQLLFRVSPSFSFLYTRLYIHPSLSHPLLPAHPPPDRWSCSRCCSTGATVTCDTWKIKNASHKTTISLLLLLLLHPSSLFLHRIPASSRSNERAELARKIKLPAIVSYRFFPPPPPYTFSRPCDVSAWHDVS